MFLRRMPCLAYSPLGIEWSEAIGLTLNGTFGHSLGYVALEYRVNHQDRNECDGKAGEEGTPRGASAADRSASTKETRCFADINLCIRTQLRIGNRNEQSAAGWAPF